MPHYFSTNNVLIDQRNLQEIFELSGLMHESPILFTRCAIAWEIIIRGGKGAGFLGKGQGENFSVLDHACIRVPLEDFQLLQKPVSVINEENAHRFIRHGLHPSYKQIVNHSGAIMRISSSSVRAIPQPISKAAFNSEGSAGLMP